MRLSFCSSVKHHKEALDLNKIESLSAKHRIRRPLGSALPLCLLPGQSDSGAQIATWAFQQPSQTSLASVLILSQAMPVKWQNWLEEVEVVLICVLTQATQVAI